MVEKYLSVSSVISLQFEGEEWRDPTNMREIVPLAQTLRLYSSTPLLPSNPTDGQQFSEKSEKDFHSINGLLIIFWSPSSLQLQLSQVYCIINLKLTNVTKLRLQFISQTQTGACQPWWVTGKRMEIMRAAENILLIMWWSTTRTTTLKYNDFVVRLTIPWYSKNIFNLISRKKDR